MSQQGVIPSSDPGARGSLVDPRRCVCFVSLPYQPKEESMSVSIGEHDHKHQDHNIYIWEAGDWVGK